MAALGGNKNEFQEDKKEKEKAIIDLNKSELSSVEKAEMRGWEG